MLTTEMKELLNNIADLCDKAGEEVVEDDETREILEICDNLVIKIDMLLSNAKLIICIESNKNTKKEIKTVSVFDNRTQRYWTKEQIQERGIEKFLNLDDLKETLNWNLNGDSSKYQFKWGQSGKDISEGTAYVFS